MAINQPKPSEQAEEIYNSGVVLCQAGNFKEAEKCFSKVIELDPEHVDAWHNKGIALDGMGKRKEAEKCFQKSIELEPHNDIPWKNKGFSLYKLNKYSEAIKCYDKALKINNKNPETWFLKGISIAKLNRNVEAEKCFKKAVELNPNYADACFNEGVMLHRIGKGKEANKWFEKAGKLNPLYAGKTVAFLFLFLLGISSMLFFMGNSITAHVIRDSMYCDESGCSKLCSIDNDCDFGYVCCNKHGFGACIEKDLCLEYYDSQLTSDKVLPQTETPLYLETNESRFYMVLISLTMVLGIFYYVYHDTHTNKKDSLREPKYSKKKIKVVKKLRAEKK